MPELTANLIQDIGAWGNSALAWFEATLPALKVFSLFVSGLLVWGIVYSILKSGWHYWKLDQWLDQKMAQDLPQRHAYRAWQEVTALIQKADDRAAWIEALRKANEIAEEGLKIKQQAELTLPEAETARRLFQNASTDPDFPLTHSDAIQALRAYKKEIKELGLL